jgi:hypothetical protein
VQTPWPPIPHGYTVIRPILNLDKWHHLTHVSVLEPVLSVLDMLPFTPWPNTQPTNIIFPMSHQQPVISMRSNAKTALSSFHSLYQFA